MQESTEEHIDFSQFIQENREEFVKILSDKNINISPIDFVHLHTILSDINLTILKSIVAILDKDRENWTVEFQDIVEKNRKKIDEYFISIFQERMEQYHED